MSRAPLLLFILLGLLGGFFLKEPFANYYSQDPEEYCEWEGIYYDKAARIYEAIEKQGYLLGGMEYAYVCNNNKLNIEEVLKFRDTFRIYGITRGNVSEIPSGVSQLSGLTSVQLQDQKINSLPPEIGALRKLKILKLGGNSIESLPPEIGKLGNLEVLLLYDNKLSALPPEVGNLENLRILDLRYNRLKTLPQDVASLRDNLEKLYLGENAFSEEEKLKIHQMLPETQIYF